MEGFLPSPWWQMWILASLPFVLVGLYRLRKIASGRRDALPLLAMAGAFIFVLSSLKLPSVTGSCSHPTGTGLSAILFGPFLTPVLGLIVLLYQALFLAHGGITTLGANIFSMGIAGPLAGYAIYRAGIRSRMNTYMVVFAAAAAADLVTYIVASAQLALAFPAAEGGFLASFIAFGAIFAFTQVPLSLVEGMIVALIFKHITILRGDLLVELDVLSRRRVDALLEAAA